MANKPGTEKVKGIFDWQGITMTQDKKQKCKDMTLKSLETQLCSLAKVKVPETLEAKLLAAIPDSGPKITRYYQVKRHQRIQDFGAIAVAAVLIFALMFMINYGLSIPSQMLSAELNDTSLCYTRWEQNNFLYDQNNTCIEKFIPGELKLPVINLNEPGY